MPKRTQTKNWTDEQWEIERAACRERATKTSFHIFNSAGKLVRIYKKRDSAIIYCNDNDGTHYVKVMED